MAKYDEYLNYFKYDVIARAYQYAQEDYVQGLIREDADHFHAFVDGTQPQAYDVRINLARPHESQCTCEYAKLGNMCKHMAAVYFTAFPESMIEYENAMVSPYDEYDYYYDDEEDDEEEEDRYDTEMYIPTSYETLLDDFLNSLSQTEMKEILRTKLNQDKVDTFDRYLKPAFNEIMRDHKKQWIEKLKEELVTVSEAGRHTYDNHQKPALSLKWKEEISSHDDLGEEIIPLIKREGLFVYEDVEWLSQYLINHDTEVGIRRFAHQLEYFMSSSYMEETEQNHILIAQYLLNQITDIDEIAFMILKYCGKKEFVSYVLDHCDDLNGLYEALQSSMNNSVYNRKEIHQTLLLFYDRIKDEKIRDLADYYDYCYNFNRVAWDRLSNSPDFETVYYPKLLQAKDHVVKDMLAARKESEKLYAFLKKNNDIWGMIKYAPVLDEKYHDELASLFTNEFYKHIETADKREDYRTACQYINALADLKNGHEMIEQIVVNLNKDERYKRRSALFDEIKHAY